MCSHSCFEFITVKMSKRKSIITHEEAIAYILEWIDNEGDDEINEMPLNTGSDGEYRSDSSENEDSEVETDGGDGEVRPQRKLLTKKRLVHDIDSSLNEENYDDLHFVNGQGQWETLTGYLGPKKDKNTKTITWTSDYPLQGRQRACDVLSFEEKPLTLLGKARDIETIKDSFELLFSDDMFELLVRETNLLIKKKLETLPAKIEHLFES